MSHLQLLLEEVLPLDGLDLVLHLFAYFLLELAELVLLFQERKSEGEPSGDVGFRHHLLQFRSVARRQGRTFSNSDQV